MTRYKVHYIICENGEVMISHTTKADEDDLIMTSFLYFSARDMVDHPERIRAVTE